MSQITRSNDGVAGFQKGQRAGYVRMCECVCLCAEGGLGPGPSGFRRHFE